MPKTPKESSKNKKNNKTDKNNKYNADNEIIIGVTTKPKEKVRVDNKANTRTKPNVQKKKVNKNTKNTKDIKKTTNKKTINNKHIKNDKKQEDKIKRNNTKRVIVSIFILFIIAICGTIYYLTTPAFNIQDIKVYGSKKISEDTYISLTQIDIGTTNIFATSKNSIKRKIEEEPYVESATIKRKLPNILEVSVKEREVSYQIEYHGNYVYLDEQGYILEISENKKDVPIIIGLSSNQEEITPGKRLNNEDLLKLDTILRIINYCKYNSIESKIDIINVNDISNYILELKKDKKKVYLGDASNLSERILWLKTILIKEKDNSGEIYINGDLNKDKVYFREK